MKKSNCLTCSKIIYLHNSPDRFPSGLCRICFDQTRDKTKGRCVACQTQLSTTTVHSKGKRCRNCWRKHLLSQRLYWQNYDWLYEHYIVLKLSVPKIALQVDAYQSRIEWWLKKFQIPMRSQGEWKGGKTQVHGYKLIWLPNHPRACKARPYIPEHVLIMENHLGRFITKGENVHHKNGIRSDNRIENLQLFSSTSAHKTYEGYIQSFAKKLLWGDIEPNLSTQLLELFKQFLSKNGYNISV